MNQVARKIAASKWWPCRGGTPIDRSTTRRVRVSVGNVCRVEPGKLALAAGLIWRRFPSHFRNDFQGQRIFDSLGAGRSPRERSVPRDQDCTDLFGIEVFEALDDDIAGFPLVGALDLRSESSSG